MPTYQLTTKIMTTNLYKELATLQAQRKVLEAQEAQVKLQIIDAMEESGELQVVTEYGKATISHRTTYTYTEAVAKITEKLKLAKTKEEQSGKATAKETTYLTFTSNSK